MSIGLGGGSIICFSENNENVTIGPKSLGYKILQ